MPDGTAQAAGPTVAADPDLDPPRTVESKPLSPQSARPKGSAATVPHGVLPVVASGVTVERSGRRLLDGIDLTVELACGPTVTAVMGPNGAGKSLLLRVMARLVRPDAGHVTWAGSTPDRARAPALGFVFQRPVMLRRSALANMRFGLWAAGLPRGRRRDVAVAALERAGLSHLAGSPARTLSGGEQQRLAIARALAVGPQVLFLDEPTSNLDPAATQAIEHMVADARAAGTRILLVTHDIGQARRLADDVMFLHRGRIVERQPAEHFFDRPDSPAARDFLAGRIVL